MFKYFNNKKKQEELYKNEKVFVVPFSKVRMFSDKFSMRISSNTNQYIKYFNEIETGGLFVSRNDAEGNVSIQQLIPYTIIFNKDMSKLYTAYRKKGDSRLNNVYSLGFGGHINPIDSSGKDKSLIINAAIRELKEEVSIKTIYKLNYLGTVRDLQSETKEHLGFVFAITTNNRVSIKEKDKMKGSWMDIKELYDKYYKFESWSRYIIDYLFVLSKQNKLKDLLLK